MVHVALAKWPKNQFKPVQESGETLKARLLCYSINCEVMIKTFLFLARLSSDKEYK